MSASLREEDISIVFVGNFNPKIFQPAWFALNELIRSSEAEAAKVEMIHEDVASFRTEWFNLTVVRDKFVGRTTQEPYARHLYDLALGTFRKLSHTPLFQMGINRTRVYELDTDSHWHQLGHHLVPKGAWEAVLKSPGLKIVTMQGLREDKLKGCTFVTLESQLPRRVSIQVNDHYEVEDQQKVIGASEMVKILETKFLTSQDASKNLIETLVAKYGNG